MNRWDENKKGSGPNSMWLEKERTSSDKLGPSHEGKGGRWKDVGKIDLSESVPLSPTQQQLEWPPQYRSVIRDTMSKAEAHNGL